MYDDASTWCQMLLPAGGKDDDDDKDKDKKGPGSKADNFVKLETAEDLEDYYGRGPGVPFNGAMGCKLGTSLLQSIETALTSSSTGGGDGESLFRGHLKFGHSETLMFFSSFLVTTVELLTRGPDIRCVTATHSNTQQLTTCRPHIS